MHTNELSGQRVAAGLSSACVGRAWVPLAVVASTATLTVASTAPADDPQESIRLDYRAAYGCPDQATFVSKVRDRTRRARFVEPGAPARTFEVEMRAAPRPRGTVAVDQGGDGKATRTFEADTCAEVADALALVVALAVDPPRPEATAPPPMTPPADSVFPPPPPQAPQVVAFQPQAVETAPPPLPIAASPPPPVETAPPPEARRKTMRAPPSWLSSVFAGADLALAQGVAPVLLSGPAVTAGWRSTGSHVWNMTLRASAVFAAAGPVAVPGGAASFDWKVGRIDACGAVAPYPPLRVGACARLEGGALEVAGAQVPAAQTRESAWAAAGALLHAEWSALPFLFLGADAGPTFRAVADRFFFLPNMTAYQVPFGGFEADGGLRVHFP